MNGSEQPALRPLIKSTMLFPRVTAVVSSVGVSRVSDHPPIEIPKV